MFTGCGVFSPTLAINDPETIQSGCRSRVTFCQRIAQPVCMLRTIFAHISLSFDISAM
jgi:hypothetical protein